MKYINPRRTRLNRRSRIKNIIKLWKVYISLLIVAGIAAYIVALGTIEFTKKLFSMTAYAPTHRVFAEVKTTPTPIPTQEEEIRAYVTEVFGEHADKAFKVLACENHALNPKAVNRAGNFPEGSEDRGLFQINDFHQRVENKAFLFDYKVNTHIAYNIFSRDGYSFKLWTCGRKLGI